MLLKKLTGFFLLTYCNYLSAQTPAINFYKLTNEQGLSQATVNVIYKDKQGFLWIGTDDGLNRFDGKEIITYHSDYRDPYSMPANVIYAITGDETGKIYLGHYRGGISYFDKTVNHFKKIPLDPTGNNNSPLSVVGVTYVEGNLWARTINGISRIDTKTLKVDNFYNDAFADNDVLTNVDVIEANGFIWFGSSGKGLLRIRKDGNAKLSHSWDCKKHGYTVTGITRDDDALWVASEKGIFKIKIVADNYFVEPFYLNDFLFGKMNKILVDNKRQAIWAGTKNSGIVIINKKNKNVGQLTSSGINDELTSNVVHYLLKDEENTIFVGTARGVNVCSGFTTAFNNYRNIFKKIPGFAHPVYAIHELPGGKLLLGNIQGVYLFNTSTFTLRHIPFAPKNDNDLTVYHFTPINSRLILVSTEAGVLELEEIFNHFELHEPRQFRELQKLRKLSTTQIEVINDSIAFIASYTDGLFKWNYRNHSLKQFSKKKSSSISGAAPVDDCIMKVVQSKHGELIVCCETGFSLLNLENETFENFTAGEHYPKQLPGMNIKDAYDDGNNIWVTTYGQGLQRWNRQSKTFTGFTTKEGLPNNALYAIVRFNDNFWIPTNNGLAVFDEANKKIKTFTTDDGLPDNEFNAFSATTGNSGLLHFSTINGIVSVNPRLLETNTYSPPIVVTDFTANSTNKDTVYNSFNKSGFILHAGYNSITIKYAALTYAAPSKIRYRVKMSPFDVKWVDQGNNNQVMYHRLPPGKYTFTILATNSSGNWSKTGSSVTIIIEPKWYESSWFYSVISIICLLIIYGFYRQRINELKKEQKIRSKLASDLHDDLGSTLNSISVYVNLALMEKGKEARLQKVKESTQEAITGLRDTIWVMDDKRNTIADLTARICQFTTPLAEAHDMIFKKDIAPEALHCNLTPAEKRNLYMIIKEAFNNSIKYAKATELSLRISLVKGNLCFEIKDNGRGFDTSKVSEGNGLKNMKARAREIGYEIRVEGGRGTSIHLKPF